MNYAGLEDLELIALLRQDDVKAFTEIYNRYWQRVHAMALLYVKSPQAAQDIVQDVFTKLWTNKASFCEARNFRAYLHVTARNQIISALRKQVVHVSVEEDLEEDAFLPEEQLSCKEIMTMWQKAIALLPPQQQRAYCLSRQHDMTYEQIAGIMNISALTVRTHISKAIQAIRRYISSHSKTPLGLLVLMGLPAL